MTYQDILVETRGRVGVIRLNRPQALNALNSRLNLDLGQAVAVCLYELIRGRKPAPGKAAPRQQKMAPAPSADMERLTQIETLRNWVKAGEQRRTAVPY